jgi:transmembrane sensor
MTYLHIDEADALLNEALTLIVRSHSGEDAAPSAAELELWAGRSPAHAEALAEARSLWSDTGSLRPMHPTAQGQLSRRVMMFGGIGLLGVSGYAWQQKHIPGEIVTGIAETRKIALADGSHIELSTRSGIDLDRSDTHFARLRAGQAWFDINTSPAPFRLAFGEQQLQMDQGVINLDFRASGAVAAIGAHSVSLSGADNHILNPDSVYRLAVGQKPLLLQRRAADASAWRSGKLVAEDIPLGEIIATLNDWYSGWIRLSDASLAQLPVTAVLDLRRPKAALRSLEQGLPVRLRKLGGVILSVERA